MAKLQIEFDVSNTSASGLEQMGVVLHVQYTLGGTCLDYDYLPDRDTMRATFEVPVEVPYWLNDGVCEAFRQAISSRVAPDFSETGMALGRIWFD